MVAGVKGVAAAWMSVALGLLTARGLAASVGPPGSEMGDALAAVESLAVEWTASPDPARRAFGLRMVAALASPMWPKARDRLIEDPDLEVRTALMEGIAWMGDGSSTAIDHVFCELGEAHPVGDVWLGQAALSGIGKPIELQRLIAAVPPLQGRTSRLLYWNLRPLLEPPAPDLHGYLNDELTVSAIAETLASNNDEGMKERLIRSRLEYASRPNLSDSEDRSHMLTLVLEGSTSERWAAANRLLELRDEKLVDLLDGMARSKDFYRGEDAGGNPEWLMDWSQALPQLSDAALVQILFHLKRGSNRPTLEPVAAELRRRGKPPDRETILKETEDAGDSAAVRVQFGLLFGDVDLARRGIEGGLPSPLDERGGNSLAPIESLVRSQPGIVLSFSAAELHQLFEPCFAFAQQSVGAWCAARSTRGRAPSVTSVAVAYLAAGMFATGRDFDAMWGAWRDESDEVLRSVVLRGILSSPDPRACSLRARLWNSGTVEQRRMVQEAVPWESFLDRDVDSFAPGVYRPDRSAQPAFDTLPLLAMLPALPTGGGQDALVADFAAALPEGVVEKFNHARRRDVLGAILTRAGVEAEDPTADRRRTIRHLGWLQEVDEWGGRPSFSELAERKVPGLDRRRWWLDALRAHRPVAHVRPAPLSPAMDRDLDETLDPTGPRSEWKLKVDALVERIRTPRDEGIGCGMGYREPELGRMPLDPGFRGLGASAPPYQHPHLDDPDVRVRHDVASLLWRVFRDEEGPRRLVEEAESKPESRESALRQLALIRWNGAEPLFVKALASEDPHIRAVGLWGVQRLRVKRTLPTVENLVLDPDALVARTACAVLHRFHGPESWCVLVPLLDWTGHDQRASAALVALGGFRNREVVGAIVERLPKLSWAAEGVLLTLTNHVTPAAITARRDPAATASFWREWLERSGNRPLDAWSWEGVARQVAEVEGTDADSARGRLMRLQLQVGPALDVSDASEVGEWWARVKDQGYRDVVWSGIDREPYSGEGLRLLTSLFPERAPDLLVEALANADARHAGQIHTALTDLAGIDLGDPAAVAPELRTGVIAAWRAWVASR